MVCKISENEVKAKMKSNALIVSLDRNPGGITTMVKNSSEALISLGFNVTLLLEKNSFAYHFIKDSFLNKASEVIGFSKYRRLLMRYFPILDCKFTSLVKGFDIVFVHNPNIINSIRKTSKNIKIITFNHTDKPHALAMYKNANLVLSVNKTFANIINKYFNCKKSITLGNFVYKNVCSSNLKKKKSSKLVIGSLGRMVNKKGFDLLIKAFLGSKEIDVVIGGDGPEKFFLKELVGNNKNIKILEWIDDLDTFFNKIDIFCLPSRIEPFGIVLIEAMVRKIPVVSTDCNGPVDIIKNGKNGILIKKNDSKAIYKAIMDLKGNTKLMKTLSKNGYTTVNKEYTIHAYSKKLKKIIYNLNSRKKND